MKIFGYEITINKINNDPKKHKKRKGGYRARHWTEEEDNQLIEMNERKLQHKTMAKRLDRTLPSIHGRLHILKGRRDGKA